MSLHRRKWSQKEKEEILLYADEHGVSKTSRAHIPIFQYAPHQFIHFRSILLRLDNMLNYFKIFWKTITTVVFFRLLFTLISDGFLNCGLILFFFRCGILFKFDFHLICIPFKAFAFTSKKHAS